MNTTTAFKVISFPLLGGFEIHVGKSPKGLFFYEIQDLRHFQMVDVKDNLTEGLLIQAVACALKPSSESDFLTLIHSL
jgi:hypothetical protein